MSGSSAIILWKDKILLFHRDNIPTIPDPDCWHLPGGGIEKGESPLEALKRELKEEVSYFPKNIKPIGKLKRGNNELTNLYLCRVDNSEAELFKLGPGEGQEIRFFTFKEILKLKLTSGIRLFLEQNKDKVEKALRTGNLSNLFEK